MTTADRQDAEHTGAGVEGPRAGPGRPTARRICDRLHATGSRLPPHDGLTGFHRAYLADWQHRAASRPALVPAPRTGSPAADAADRLRSGLADRYLAVLRPAPGQSPPSCWRPLLQLRGHPQVQPLQFALAAANAHIGHDLPLALLELCAARHTEPEALEAAFDQVADELTALVDVLWERLCPDPEPWDVTEPLTHLAGAWDALRARDAAWAAASALWALRRSVPARERHERALAAGTGMTSRLLLTPVAGAARRPPPGPPQSSGSSTGAMES